jgi:serine kinase of HPr protein (carbohydrate metabolism regulator)
MRPSLIIRQFLSRYQQKLNFTSREVGLEREIKLSRQASNTFDAADYFNVIRTSSIVVVGYQESRYIRKLGTILGLEFPEVSLPMAQGRNLAVLVEAATRNHLLQINGYNAAQDFITR